MRVWLRLSDAPPQLHAARSPGSPRCRILKLVQPSLDIRENVPLAPFTTFQIGGPARFFVEAVDETDVQAAVGWANDHAIPIAILGGGSNLLVRDAGFRGLVLHIAIRGIARTGDALLEVGAGESWDDLVGHAVAHNLAGIECLAGIPGSVGGTPVQNVGAYGQEVSETIESVRVFDRQTSTWQDLGNAACRFRYRESLFNTDEPNRYIVTGVRFKLRPHGAPTLRYAELQRRFADVAAPSLAEVATAVREIRRSKGMLIVSGDPDTRSAGSFFKNPIVPAGALDRVAAAAGLDRANIPHWPTTSGDVKLPAAWLLEQAGFVRGYSEGAAGISTRHTLALTNRNHATADDILRLQDQIIATVQARFDITLEREPVLLG
jgi:UDP-N-acetylmuramate dehydrogenase